MAIQFYNGLNVTGSATIAGNITITKNQPELTINDTVASDLQLVIKQSGSTSVFKSRGGTNSTGQYNFQITNGSTTTNALFINQQALSTFAGNVSLISAGTPILTIQDTTNNVKLLLYAQDGNAHVGTYSNHDLVFDTNSIKALTIDTSQNATFTGLVSGITPTAAANFVTKAYADALTPGDGVFLPLTAGNTKPLTGDLYVNSSLYIRGGNERIYMSGGGATDWRGIEASSTGLWSWGETGIGNYFSKSVGIGTGPALGRELLVKGEIAALDNTGTNDNQILMAVNDTVGNLAVTYGSTGSYVPFQLETSGQPRFGVSTAGAIRFNTYGAGTLRSDASGNITSVTSGVGTGTVTAVGSGAGLTGGTITSTGSLSHADTSSQGSVNGSNGVVIQDVTLDGFGHVTGLDTVNIETFLERGYVQKDSIDNTAIGWYTIATNGGDRAIGRFGLWDTASSRHQSVIFYAGHMFGTDGSNTITVLANNRFGTSVLRYLRIKDDTTYQGAALQVYIDDATNNLNIAILGDDFQSNGWVREDFTPDADPPGGISAAAWASFTTAGQVDLDQVDQGGIVTTGPVYSGGDTTQYRNLTTNDGSGETPAIISNGSTPTLNSGITGLEVRTLIGAGTSSSSGVTSVSDDGGSTINVSGSSTARVVSAITGTVSSSSANLATGAQIQTAIDTATTGALKFVSEWDASGLNGGSPDLRAVATHIPGNYYIVSVAGGSTPNGSGTTPNSWAVGDWCIRADLATDTWQKIDNTQVGNVTGSGSVNELAIWSSNSAISSQSRLKFIANGVTGKLLVIDGGITTTEASAFTGDLTVTGNVTALTNGSSGSLIVGRNASENIRLLVSDNTNSITAFQDSDGNGPHNFVLDRVFDGTGTNDFRVRKNGTDQLIIDTSANATFAGSITGTSASFSASINASGNSNTFGNTTTAALSASSGTFSASVTAAGNSNTFGTTTFNTQVTNFSFSGGPQLKFLEPGRAYSEGMRLIRFEDEFGFHYGENANEEAFTVDKFGNSTAHKKLIVDGNVGIGTTAPGAKLTVNQDSFSDTEGIFVQSGNNAANGGVAIFKSATKVGTISSLGSASNLTFMTNGGVEAMRITNGGGISFGSSGTAFGTSGQILKSNGNTSPTWVAASTVIGGPYLPLAGGTMTGNLKLNDNVRSIYGTNNDLEIYNDGANSFIQDVGAGSLFFKTNGAGIFFKETGGETLAQFLKDGAVNLYHNNVLKFATTSTGVTIFDTCLSNEQFQVKNTSGARYSVFGDDDTGLGDFDGANGVSLISKGKREITVKEGDITFDNYTAAAVTTTGTLNANQGNQAASQDTLANLCVDPSGEVVRGSQEGTWTFTAAQLNALTTSTTGGPILISNPGANKAVIVEETNWMVKYSGTGSMATTQAYEVRQPIWTNTSASISRLPSTKINEIMNSAQGTPSNPSYGFYSRDVPDFNNDARTFSCNQATRLNRLNTNGLPGNLVSISIKLKYRIFNADTF